MNAGEMIKISLLVFLSWILTGCAPDNTGKETVPSVRSTVDSVGEDSAVLVAAYSTEAPTIDGKIDGLWQLATPLVVSVREAIGGADARQVIMRALYTDEQLFILAEWSDTTLSDMRDPFIWNAALKQYEKPSKPDDQFAIEFPIDGDFEVNMLTTDGEFTADVWHWKAGRSNPGGWADDKRHLIRKQLVKGGREYALGGHETVYIARPMDEGTPAYVRKEKPAGFETEVVNSFGFQQASGSVADVRAKGVHSKSGWTLELARKFDTGHDDDAVIHWDKDNRFAIAILDDELYWRHSVSGLLYLRFTAK
ncbi:MAG: ethylbenzene dehydrogenase-related protein [bacterium]|nr:hypothetical protein [Gammaproteobacteria bacterium]HIL99327.1 hypothetical protein [Pseudomonadales bacterium]